MTTPKKNNVDHESIYEAPTEATLVFPYFCEGNTFDRHSKSFMLESSRIFSRNFVFSLGYTLLALAIQIIFGGTGGWAFPDGKPACLPDHSVNTNICYMVNTLTNGAESLKFLTGFILGGFLLSSVNMWRLRRTSYAALCGSTRNLLINICSLVEDPTERSVMARWALLGYELAVLKSRGLIDTVHAEKYLERHELLRSNEWERMVDGDRHTTVWFWIQTKACRLKRDERLDGTARQTLCDAVTLSRDKANDLMSSLDRDHPSPYIYICAFLTNFNLTFHSLRSGIEFSTWMYNHGWAVYKEPGMWAEVVVLFLYTSVLAMLFDVCALLYNPFGSRDIDINHRDIGRGIRNLGSCLSCHIFPETMDPRCTIQNES
uniref:Uncharacterized protein n=1 Tax=Corethron hystrix TaxID=216773 RepID=A0A7S1BGC9_9STRA|mmetsp:Transcript_25125/g.58087  ORF Transcript_25125/g.58087 Transcript_25125/m.58087 type:complete len:375 (+) Transcript_25125:117-1241(+)